MSSNKNTAILVGAVVAAIAIVAGVYYYRQGFGEKETLPTAAQPQRPMAPIGPQHPLPEAPAAEPLPPLDESDEPARSALTGIFGQAVQDFIIPRNIVRHLVATVDNLPRDKLALRLSPLKTTPGTFAVTGEEDSLTLSPDNYQRYAPLLTLIQAAPTVRIVDTYLHYYPLLQMAYQDLGYPDRYFNDRVVEVIDHLLATPEVKGPIALRRPSVVYEYADPALESLSVGQKALLRMGPEQARSLQAKLREFRAAIVAKGQEVKKQSADGAQG